MSNQCSFAFELTEELFASGKDAAYFLDTLIEHSRTLLHIKLGKQPTLSSDNEPYLAASHLYSEDQCLYILDYLIQWQQQLSRIPFKRVFLEMILLHIIRSKYRLSPANLVKRLIDLEQQLKIPAPLPPVEAKAPIIVEEQKLETPVRSPEPVVSNTAQPTPGRYETLLRFAAVELEGTTKKEG